MPDQTRNVRPGKIDREVTLENGTVLQVPSDWAKLLPGDAALTRRVKKAVPTWTVQEKKGRRTFSQGIWADAATIERIREQLAAERSTDAYARRRVADRKRREKKQEEYVEDFRETVLRFLAFDAAHANAARQMADAIAAHATPVGSGTVARTQRIPIEQRAESAVIAWMRHQTTAYDNMKIARVKGKRREVRRMLAERSRNILDDYRKGTDINPMCPLSLALRSAADSELQASESA